jgi:glutamine amidotransferase
LLDNKEEEIVVVDYGVGNLGSVVNMLKKVGASNAISTSDHQKILSADKIIVPGVGSFDHGMTKLRESGTDEVLLQVALGKKAQIMGICLGMQLLTEGSEEGNIPGLGLISGYAKKFTLENCGDLKVPHMGWNSVNPVKQHYLLRQMQDETRFYFVHSYFVECNDSCDVLMTSKYGREFVSSFQKENVIGCQFHPEKSHRFGMQLFSNFVQESIC